MSDIDQNRLIDKYERLFAEEGWKELVLDFGERQRNLKDILVQDLTATEKTLYISQGQNSVYDFVINLEATVAAIKQNQQESLALDLPEVNRAFE